MTTPKPMRMTLPEKNFWRRAPMYMPQKPPRPNSAPRAQSGATADIGVEGRNHGVKAHPGHRGEEGAQQGRPGDGVDGQLEDGRQEGGDNGAAADAVGAADEAHHQGQDEQGRGVEGEGFP